MAQITLKGISKRFTVYERDSGRKNPFARRRRVVEALKEMSFSIERGELVGYIGPNGAGKSTSVKIMGGILTPDEGECRILNLTPWREREKHVQHIGVVFGQRSQLWWDVAVMDSMELLRDIYGLSQEDFKTRLDELSERLGIGELLKTPARQLSLGQRMRCEVGAALLHRPEILFLDEPTIGLDAVSKLQLREFLIQENRERGVTMLLTTHDMADVEALCSRVMVIGHGQKLYDGSLEALRRRYDPLSRLEIALSGPADIPPASQIPGVARFQRAGERLYAFYDPAQSPVYRVMADLAQALPVRDIQPSRRDVDEIIADMYREMEL